MVVVVVRELEQLFFTCQGSHSTRSVREKVREEVESGLVRANE